MPNFMSAPNVVPGGFPEDVIYGSKVSITMEFTGSRSVGDPVHAFCSAVPSIIE